MKHKHHFTSAAATAVVGGGWNQRSYPEKRGARPGGRIFVNGQGIYHFLRNAPEKHHGVIFQPSHSERHQGVEKMMGKQKKRT
jgi:hypothetical protein